MEILKKDITKNILWTILYAIVTLIFVINHEIWADEAQVWLLVQNLSVFELLKHLVNEGHPAFFYLLVMPFAKAGFPIFSMQIICWLCSSVAVFLLLQFSPFSKFSKFAITASAGMFYFFPVIARSYSILPLLIFASAILYKKSNTNPSKYSIPYAIILALCASTHVIMFAFVFILGCYFIYDNFLKEKNISKQTISATSIIFLSLFAVIIQLCGTFESNSMIKFETTEIFQNTINTLIIFFLNSVGLLYKSMFGKMHVTLFSAIAGFTMFVMFIIFHIKLWFIQKRMAVLSLLAIGFQFFIYVVSYRAMLYHTRIFSAYLILIFSFWIALLNKNIEIKGKFLNTKKINIMLGIFFLLTSFCGLHAAILDLLCNYSSAKQTADFLQQNTPQNAVIIPNYDAFSLAVRQSAPEKYFFSPYLGKELKYMIWYNPGVISDDMFTKLVEKRVKENNFKNVYILVSSFFDVQHLEKTLPQKYKLIYESEPSIAIGEAFRVYKYKN